jgi:UDP-glucose 4-epimerase
MGSTTRRRWAYAATKALDEFLALAYHLERGLPVILGRFFNTVGPRQTGQWGMVLPSFVGRALRGETIQVYGDGTQQRCLCMVHDTVRAVLGLLARDDAWGQAFNIGSEEEITIQGLAERVRDRVGSDSAIELVPYAEAYGEGFEDMARRKPDTRRIRELIGWRPEYTLDQIIDATAEHMRNAPVA